MASTEWRLVVVEIVGCFPMRVYCYDALQISYRGRVVEGEAVISHEHNGARWAKASYMRALPGRATPADVQRS